MEHTSHTCETPVAVVGLGCRFPGANSPEEFWANLLANVDAVGEVPGDRFDLSAHYDPQPETPGKTVSRHGGFLDDPFAFDAGFFGISPVEATTMDPQQRILLQVVWEALEAAGIRPSALAGSRSGVFVGQATAEYAETAYLSDGPTIRNAAGCRLRAVTAGRVSYALDLRGPSLVLDTACSSSLVAVHSARQSLLAGECDLAIAGGVNIILSPEDSIAYSQGGMLSPRGRCRFGDASADGFVRSEGVGVVVLKRLADALRDGDTVLATLLGSAVTNDGRGSGLLLQPAVSGQVDMVREACLAAGVTPGRLDYVEAHGTGTRVGDSVELRALAAAAERPADRPLLTGSVKSNIGHAEAAAGIAGMIKAVLIARHGVLPASLHCEQPSPVIADGQLSVAVVTRNQPLAPMGGTALIGVSSFGISGTNAHAVIGEYRVPAVPAPAAADPGEPQLLVLSARSRRALTRAADAYAAHLEPGGRGREVPLRDLCAAAALRRDAHPYRMWVTGTTHDDLARKLRALARGEATADGGQAEAGFGGVKRNAFVFPGQGSQWLGMGRGLLARSAAFRAEMTACDAAIRDELGWSVLELLTEASEFPTAIDQVQPALWAIEVSLAAALGEAGVRPDVCVGHSMGETAAARVAGALSLRDACAVICRRSRLMRRLAGQGAMLAVELSADEAEAAIAGYGSAVCVAVENSPVSTVVAGPQAELAELAERLRAREVFCRLVKVEVASHSPGMDLLREDLLSALEPLAPRPVVTAMVSSVLAAPVDGGELGPEYWMDNLRRPVRFAGTVRAMADAGDTVFLEVSPHPVLTAAIEETLGGVGGSAVPTLRRAEDERTALVRAVGQVYAHGGRVDWERWFRIPAPNVPLPTYAWDQTPLRQQAAHPAAAAEAEAVRETTLAHWGSRDWGEGVTVHGVAPVVPTVYAAAILDAAGGVLPDVELALRDLRLVGTPLTVDEADNAGLRVTVGHGNGGAHPVRVECSRDGGAWTPCASAEVLPSTAEQGGRAPGALDAALSRCRRYLSAADFHALAEGQGYHVGEAFRSVEQLWRRDGEVVARMRRAKVPQPAAWETGLQPLMAAWATARESGGYTTVSFGRMEFHADLPDEFWSVCRFTPERGGRRARADVVLLDAEERVLARILGIELLPLGGRPLPPASPLATVAAQLRARTRELSADLLRRGTSALMGLTGPAAPVPAGPWEQAGRALEGTDRGRSGRPSGRPSGQPEPPTAPSGPAPAAAPTSPAEVFLERAANVLGLSVTGLDRRRPLRDLGLDSLMATQLRRQLREGWQIELTAGRLLGPESVDSILATIG